MVKRVLTKISPPPTRLRLLPPFPLPPNRRQSNNTETPTKSSYPIQPHSYGQKNPRVRKIRVRNSGAGNGCANFMDTWKKSVLSAGKPVSVKFLLFRGGGWGGGECRFYFYGRADFSDMGARNDYTHNSETSPSQVKKAREEIQHKQFWGPQDCPPRNSLCLAFFL